jgi:hypothetical protein
MIYFKSANFHSFTYKPPPHTHSKYNLIKTYMNFKKKYEYLLMMTGDPSTPWAKPIGAYGYDEVQKHLFEANTVCVYEIF